MAPVYDLFLSHNSEDKPAVREVADALKRRRLKPWLDVENLTPGRLWQDQAEEVIRTCRGAAVFVGQSGIGPWEHEEMRALLTQLIRRDGRLPLGCGRLVPPYGRLPSRYGRFAPVYERFPPWGRLVRLDGQLPGDRSSGLRPKADALGKGTAHPNAA